MSTTIDPQPRGARARGDAGGADSANPAGGAIPPGGSPGVADLAGGAALADPPDFPPRPVPPGLARRARRTALRLRVVRTTAVAVVGAGLIAGIAVAATPAIRQGGGPGPEPSPQPPVFITNNQAPRTSVGLGANAWVQFQGWCVGDIATEGDTGVVESCHFMPGSGGLDVTVLDPGRFAPEGYSLVVAVAVGQTAPGVSYHGQLTDGTGTDGMAVERAVGMPGVVFLWGFTNGEPVAVRVTNADGTTFAECTDCARTGR